MKKTRKELVQDIFETNKSSNGTRRSELIKLFNNCIAEDLDGCITLQNLLSYMIIEGLDSFIDKSELPAHILKKKYVLQNYKSYLGKDETE